MSGRDRRLAACPALQFPCMNRPLRLNVHLDERAIPMPLKLVNLAGLDDENVPRPPQTSLPFHGPYSAAFPDTRVSSWDAGAAPGPLPAPAEQKKTRRRPRPPCLEGDAFPTWDQRTLKRPAPFYSCSFHDKRKGAQRGAAGLDGARRTTFTERSRLCNGRTSHNIRTPSEGQKGENHAYRSFDLFFCLLAR